jgi:hypothetical protein
MWWLIGFLFGLLVVNVAFTLAYLNWRKHFIHKFTELIDGHMEDLENKYYLIDQENERSIRYE